MRNKGLRAHITIKLAEGVILASQYVKLHLFVYIPSEEPHKLRASTTKQSEPKLTGYHIPETLRVPGPLSSEPFLLLLMTQFFPEMAEGKGHRWFGVNDRGSTGNVMLIT